MATANSDRQLLLGEASESNACGTVYVGNSCKATFNPGTGVLTAKTFCGSLSGTATTATCVVKTVSGASQAGVIYFCTNCTNASCASTNYTTCICGANGFYYGNICGNVCGLASRANYSTCLYNRQTGASKVSNVLFYTGCTNASCTATNYASCICGANGFYYGNVCGCLCGLATKASQDSAGCAFGTAARYACTCFLSATGCAQDSACLTGKTPDQLSVGHADCAICANNAYIHQPLNFSIMKLCYSSLLCGECYCKDGSGIGARAYFSVCFRRPVVLYCEECNVFCYIPAEEKLTVVGACTCSCASLCSCWQTMYGGYYRFW